MTSNNAVGNHHGIGSVATMTDYDTQYLPMRRKAEHRINLALAHLSILTLIHLDQEASNFLLGIYTSGKQKLSMIILKNLRICF